MKVTIHEAIYGYVQGGRIQDDVNPLAKVVIKTKSPKDFEKERSLDTVKCFWYAYLQAILSSKVFISNKLVASETMAT